MNHLKKIYIIAGEASGDLHGSNLVKALLLLQPELVVRAWGGDLMEQAGAQVVKHYRDLAFMGFAEVVMNLRTILGNIRFCKEDVLAFAPDALILIDYPGFNLRIAEWARERGIPVFYYISPQVWAWKKNRVEKIRKFVNHMYVVLPFEKEFYSRYNYEVEFVGHPLLDVVAEQGARTTSTSFCEKHSLPVRPIIALLPGSRKQEISAMLPLMLTAAEKFKGYQFVVAGAPGRSRDDYQPFLLQSNVSLIFDATYELLSAAAAGLVTSGTATLEAALFEMPQVVCYKANPISYWIAKRVVKVKYISLVNLILDREAVKELIQDDLNAGQLEHELRVLLEDQPTIERLKTDYKELFRKLGGPGASAKVASRVLKSPEMTAR